MRERAYQVLLIVSFAGFSWLAFMAIHEFGHICFARLSGASTAHVDLHPLRISWSAFVPNPHPQIVAWGGPLLGVAIPLILFAIGRVFRAPGLYLFQFFADFCLIANGIYVLIDAFVQKETVQLFCGMVPRSGSYSLSLPSQRRLAFGCGTDWATFSPEPRTRKGEP